MTPPAQQPRTSLGQLPPRSLKQNMLYAVVGMGVFHACQQGVIVLFSKFSHPDVLGQFRYALDIAQPIIVCLSFELRGALVADTAGEFTFGTYRQLRSLLMILAGALLVGIGVVNYLGDRNAAFAGIFLGACATRIVLSLAEVGWGFFQKRERLDLMAASAMLRGGAMLAGCAVVPFYYWLYVRGVIPAQRLPEGAAWALALYAAASLLILAVYDRPRVRRQPGYDPHWTGAALWRLARQTFPLGLVLLIIHLCNSIPELVMARQPDGKAALGYFGALATVTLAPSLLLVQGANAAGSRLSTYYRTDARAFLRLTGRLLGLALVVGGGMLVGGFGLGRWLLMVLYRTDYASFYPEFKIILFAQSLALLTSVFGILTTQMRLFWLQVPVQVAVLVGTVIATALLIPHADNLVRAGAWTLLARSGIQFALYAGCLALGLLLRSRFVQGAAAKPPLEAPAGETLEKW